MPTVFPEAFLGHGHFEERMMRLLLAFERQEVFVVQGMAHIVAAACPRPCEDRLFLRAGQAGGTQPRTAQEGAANERRTSGSRGAHAPAQQGHTSCHHASLGAASAQSA